MKRNKGHLGITLMETIVVVAVIVILSAVSVWGVFSFIEAGRQTNRMNIARTLYLAAQNQLTQLRVTGGLDDFVERANPDGEERRVIEQFNNPVVGWNDPEEIRDYVHFISRAAGTPAYEDCPVMELLGSVLVYNEITNDAVLIEFNIRTGVVLSAFYGDRFVSGHFVYNDDSPNGAFAGIGTAVRGAGYESIARGRNRRQGFYGVSVTGQVAEGINPLSVTIIDNHTGFAPLEGTVNKLFARAIIPPQYSLDMFTLTLEQNGAAIGSVSFDLSSYDWESDKLYTEYVTADGESLIVWILDLVEGDTTEINYISEHSISTLGIAPDAFIRAMIDNDTRGSHAVSFAAHPYFGVGSANNQFVISSARHLFNIRFAQSGEFVQWDNIYLNLAGSVVTNFEPIPDFFGDFCGNGFNISSLSIDNFIRNEDDIGLFARTSFDSNVRNLTLVDPRIICSYRNNAGAVAGVLQGNISNVHVFGNEMISAASNVGGIVGTVSGGELRDSAFVSTRRVALVSGNSAGGIVGFYEGGSISRLLLLAKAPIDTEDIIAPIVGSYNERPNDDNLIYLYGIGIRPTMAEYNTLPANLGSPRDTLAIRDLHLSLPWPTPPDMADEDAISLENTRYPYPIFGPRNFSGDWGWPITVGGSLQIFYFERYDNHTTGFFSFEGRVDTLVNDRRILRAGYVAIVETQAPLTDSFRRSRLQLLVGNELEPIDINLINIVGTDFENYFGNNDTYFYIFRLPPDEFPDVATSPLRIRYGAADIPEARRDEAMREHVDDEEFYLHPYFAHAIYDSGNALDTFMVRTPWQMGNISYMPQDNNLTYVQTRNINFFLDGYGPVNCPETWLNLDIRTAVVTTPFRGTYEGNYHSLTLNRAALFNQTEPNSRVRNFSLTNTIINRPDDTGSAGAIANTANGFVYNIDVQNPFVLVGGSAGGAIGTLGGEAFRINVRYNSNQEIYGSLHAGGIVGDIQGGHLRDSVFMSTRPQSHVMGSGTLGGLVGVNNGSMTRLALLALAPETGEHLFPIEGGGAGGTDVFFLQGTPIRPSSAEVGGAYNIGDFHSGTALSTFRTAMGTTPGFREANALTAQWKVLHLEEEEYAIRLDNEIFPYPFFIPTDTDVDEWPWPIVLSFSYFHGNVFYFERYANRYGLFPLRPAMPAGMGMLNNTSVLEAGYMVVVSDEEYEEISAFDVPVLRVEVGHELWHDISLDHFVPNSPAVGWRSHRLCNDELADLLTQRHGVNNYRPLRIVMGADEDNEYSFIHPLFAQAVFSMDSGLGSTVNPFTVRTPWQMQNINQMPNNASNLYFRQGRNMDIAADGAGNTGNGAGADITGTSVVTVNFAGAYNGDFFTISSTPRALFGTNSGVVQGIIMRDSNISGGVNVGSIANINNGVIRRIGVENTTIGGTNNVGGIVGNNTNIVEDVYFLSTASHDEQPVYGTATGASRAIGGIVGNNTGTVTRAIYLAPAPSVREDTNVNLYPIIGRGDEAVPDTTFFLMGHVYTPDAEHRYIEDVAPDDTIDIPYNFRSPGETLTIHNGGIGMRAGQLHFGNINSDFDNILLGTWTMEDPYPYPVLIGMRGIPRA
ncbi:MAG: hypothetical protein FWF78_02030, partial [Defluviitaleaceae bacterium]|nr:hypothetical protein [Defluviitaleaceae bacterium]